MSGYLENFGYYDTMNEFPDGSRSYIRNKCGATSGYYVSAERVKEIEFNERAQKLRNKYKNKRK